MYYAFLRKEIEGQPGEFNVVRFGNEDLQALRAVVDEAYGNGYVMSDLDSWVEQLKKSPDFQEKPVDLT